jgi:enterochelin esterase-like enzyme
MRINTAVLVACLLLVFAGRAAAQSSADADFKPASSNVPGAEFPKLDAARRAQFRLVAPQADKVELNLSGRHAMTKDENGVWTITTAPLVVGFHYYSFVVNGASVADPGSEAYFGSSWMSSGIEVPDPAGAFYETRNVPHGEVRVRPYFSKIANAWRQAYIYTPPGYDQNTSTRYPVLYLQHGAGEDERGWTIQGRANFILDNLIAGKAAVPMIIVMDNGGGSAIFANRGGGARGGRAAGAPGGRGGARGAAGPGAQFGEILLEEIVPMVEANYRTRTDRNNRAIAGLSMGAGQALQIGLANLDRFAYIGAFSGGLNGDPNTIHNGVMANAREFNGRVKTFYISIGTEENVKGARTFHEALEQHGIRHQYFESEGTAHEWQTWRRSLHGFVPLLFR